MSIKTSQTCVRSIQTRRNTPGQSFLPSCGAADTTQVHQAPCSRPRPRDTREGKLRRHQRSGDPSTAAAAAPHPLHRTARIHSRAHADTDADTARIQPCPPGGGVVWCGSRQLWIERLISFAVLPPRPCIQFTVLSCNFNICLDCRDNIHSIVFHYVRDFRSLCSVLPHMSNCRLRNVADIVEPTSTSGDCQRI